jgi:hypothetical protein
MKRTLFIILTLLGNLSIVFAQQSLPLVTNIKGAYIKQTRSLNGSPGRNYWQNHAYYDIKVNFDPATRFISGKVNIDYVNSSPDTLKQLVVKLDANLYQQQSQRNVAVAPDDLTKGVKIENLKIDGKMLTLNQQKIRGTNMYVDGVEIMPGNHIHLEMDFSYTLNKGSFIRTGQVDSGAFVIAYFFPRIAVYDDLDGWNQYPYIGKEEFYNDYCNFKAAITVPANYETWATGELVNPQDVYQPRYADRIKKASNSDDVVDIITNQDIAFNNITKQNTENTWCYEANNVTDFAFTVSNHYVWKSTSVEVDHNSKRRTRVDAVFNPAHLDYLPVINYARKTVQLISFKFPGIPFPFSHQTIFEGLDAMEYPMMVNNLPFKGSDAVTFTVHEIFHAVFPFFVGNNETKYSFLDEGWATLSEFTLAEQVEPSLSGKYDISDFEKSAGSDQDVPIMTLTPQLYGKARFSDKDLKPAIAFFYLREMLGDSVFRQGIKKYIAQWHGRHPSPYDFFACMNAGTGKDLNWYWKNWFFEKQVPDMAIAKVTVKARKCSVTIKNIGGAFVPVHLTINFKDGTSESLALSSQCWKKGNQSVDMVISVHKPIEKILLGRSYDADADRSNNVWIVGKNK